MFSYFAVSTTSCDILIALRDRFEAEKEWLLSALRFEQGQQRSRHLLLSYARLIWQHLVSQLDDAFLMSAIATGLAERSQEYNSERCKLVEQAASGMSPFI